MFQTCVKYFFIIFCGFFLYFKLLNLKGTKNHFFVHGFFSLLLAILIYYVRLCFAPTSILILMTSFTIIVSFIYKQPFNITIITSCIAMACSYVLFTLSVIITSPIALIFMQMTQEFTSLYNILFLLVGFLQLILSTLPFRFNRLKNGMPFLKQQTSNDIGAFITISLLISVSFFDAISQNKIFILIPIFFIAMCGVIIFFWWRNKITESYIKKLKEREINTLEEEINELKLHNETLSKIIHKDNKLIPAMELAVRNTLLETADNLESEQRCNLQDTLSQLESISKERKGILHICDSQARDCYSTGAPTIDSLLKYLSAKAYAEQTNLGVIISQRVHPIIPDIISENDFRTLIADLAENALIAVRNVTNRNILIHTKMEEDVFCIEFYDSGIPFSKEVLENLGKRAITTHKNDGGSGIGFMTVFEILRRCNASLLIDENLSGEIYKKKIAIRFDSLGEYSPNI